MGDVLELHCYCILVGSNKLTIVRKTRMGQTRYLVGSVPDRRTGEGPDAGCMTKVCGIGNMKGVKA